MSKKTEPNLLDQVDPIAPDKQGVILLDGTGVPLLIFDDMSEREMADYLDDMTSLQLSAILGRLTVITHAVEQAINSKPRDPRPRKTIGVMAA